MYQDYVDGGFRVPNMEVMAKSLKLSWISRFLSTDVLSRKENWKAIPYHFFREYGGLNVATMIKTMIKNFQPD